jgi:hypothetical protein
VFGLIAAAAIGIGEYATKLPSERTVVVRVAEGEGIDSIELVWHEGDEVVHRTWLGAPFTGAKSGVRLSDGRHRVELAIHRGDRVSHAERHIDVDEDASEITLDVP